MPIGLTYCPKKSDKLVSKDWIMRPFARILYGRISTGYATFKDTLNPSVSFDPNRVMQGHAPAKILEEVMKEDDHDDPLSWANSPGTVLDSCQGNPYCKRTTHARA
jgi:hypothetical protein